MIKMANIVSRATLFEIIIPALGFNIANVLEPTAEADSIKISVTINSTSFY